MKIFFLTILALFSGYPLGVQAQIANDYDLSPLVLNRIHGIESDYEQTLQRAVKDFRLVRTVGLLPPINGPTVKLPIRVIDSDRLRFEDPAFPALIASFVDIRNGQTRSSCRLPCDLTVPDDLAGIVVVYRYGSEPQQFMLRGRDVLEKGISVALNFNEVEHQVERDRCALEFKALIQERFSHDAEPCVRVPPTMPRNAYRSGHCEMTFTVSRHGEPLDVVARACTDQLYCEPSQAAVRRWIYYPALRDGEAVERAGVEPLMTYRLVNERGDLIPPPNEDELQPCIGII